MLEETGRASAGEGRENFCEVVTVAKSGLFRYGLDRLIRKTQQPGGFVNPQLAQIGLWRASEFRWHHPDFVIDALSPYRECPEPEKAKMNKCRDQAKYAAYLCA